MNILHIAPHYGGGIAPAVVGIIENTKALHTLVGVEETRDSASLALFKNLDVVLQDFESIQIRDGVNIESDIILFHFWNSKCWAKLRDSKIIFQAMKTVLLNHQSFSFNAQLAIKVGALFDRRVQSGFSSMGLPKSWSLVPTCQNESSGNYFDVMRETKAIFVGTLDYKKLSRDFISLANTLTLNDIPIEVYGNLDTNEFAEDLMNNKNPSVRYMGYLADKFKVFKNATYFFYPLRPSHYGTTENSLLEAMLEGLIPLVKRNPVERTILGDNLMAILEIEKFMSTFRNTRSNPQLGLPELSHAVRQRALELIDPRTRREFWTEVFTKHLLDRKLLPLSYISNQISLACELYPVRNLHA